MTTAVFVVPQDVSIHAPWEGCDPRPQPPMGRHRGFNSRTLGRVRRPWILLGFHTKECFNSRTLGRVRPEECGVWEGEDLVSIHAPWEGCDKPYLLDLFEVVGFQFTHPGKGATSPVMAKTKTKAFQFTHPGKGATVQLQGVSRERAVSIHAPWEGCDVTTQVVGMSGTVFQFTHPGKGATIIRQAYILCIWRFNSRTLGRVRRRCSSTILVGCKFQFTHPGKGAT